MNKILESRYLIPAVFFVLVFLFFTYPLGLSDYWWHMNTGRWIWENKALPDFDPFTYSFSATDDPRSSVILTGFYLSQLLFYFIYSWLGVWGLLILKATLLTLTIWLLWKVLCYKNVQPLIAIVLITPVVILFYRFDELRPVLFSFIGVVLLFYLIEATLDKLRCEQPAGILLFAIPALMLLWANSHRGFPLGIVLLVSFSFFETAKILTKNQGSLQKPQYRIFISLCVLSALITLLNPNGYHAITQNQSELSGYIMQFLDEYQNLWTYADLYDSLHLFTGPLLVIIFCTGYMIFNYRKVDYTHWFLILGFIYQGVTRYRFSSFMLLMSLAISSNYYQHHSRVVVKKHPALSIAILIASITILASFSYHRTAFLYGPWEKAYFPTEAARFIHNKRPPDNIFNAFEYGGYLGWILNPEYRLFTDQRCLDLDVLREYEQARNGDYNEIFGKYNINTVVFYHAQPVIKHAPRIVANLLSDDDWDLVFLDTVAAVFVRKSANSGLPSIDKTRAIAYINTIKELKGSE